MHITATPTNILGWIDHDTENTGLAALSCELELHTEDLNFEDGLLTFMFPYPKQILLGQVLQQPLFLHAL